MPAEKTTAIVLRVVDFSETSCVVTMYTRDFGKITALAKGARRLRSPFEGAIDLLANCRIVFLRKSVDKLDLLTEAKLVRRFRSAATHLPRFYAGLYSIELISALTDHADPQPKLFDLIECCVQDLDNPACESATRGGLLRFEMQLLAMLGHQPSLSDCVGCGKSIGADGAGGNRRIAFGLVAGGVFCPTCRTGKRSVVGLRPEAWQCLRSLIEQDRVIANDELTALTTKTWGELRGLIDQYINHLLGYRPKMQRWLKEA